MRNDCLKPGLELVSVEVVISTDNAEAELRLIFEGCLRQTETDSFVCRASRSRQGCTSTAWNADRATSSAPSPVVVVARARNVLTYRVQGPNFVDQFDT